MFLPGLRKTQKAAQIIQNKVLYMASNYNREKKTNMESKELILDTLL
jgi:hypothetical protein